MSEVQKICDSCLKSYEETTPTGNKVSFCRVEKMAHFGKLFCENRVGREEVKERAAAIREFVANATDEQLVIMYM